MSKSVKKFDWEKFFLALADRNRLRLLNLMGDDEICVCFFVEILQMPQPKVSRHLAYLRNAGIVESRRDGKWIHYRMTPPTSEHAVRILDEVRSSNANDQEMQKDRQRLMKVCCAPQMPVTLQGAPRPVGAMKAER
jgi:ArsR family transcriptional regulator, arsenate/arsenite/antimonite-responsive transcriptional repressor